MAEHDGAPTGRVPLHLLSGIVAFAPVLMTPALIGACAGAGITLVILDRN